MFRRLQLSKQKEQSDRAASQMKVTRNGQSQIKLGSNSQTSELEGKKYILKHRKQVLQQKYKRLRIHKDQTSFFIWCKILSVLYSHQLICILESNLSDINSGVISNNIHIFYDIHKSFNQNLIIGQYSVGNIINMFKIYLLASILLIALVFSTPSTDLDAALQNIRKTRQLMGIQLQVTNRTHTLYHGNFGSKDNSKPITNETMFRIASCSKSVAAAAVMLLVEEKKITLNQTLDSILGFPVKNPNFPTAKITVEMTLSHQSSLIECDPYYSNFLIDGYNAKSGYQVPPIRQILVQGGKYYNKCLFSSAYPPGTHYLYVNLNFGIAGAIVQKVSGIRFDIFLRQRILKHLSVGLPQVATFYSYTIQNPDHLGATFVGQGGKWVPSNDYYPDGKIPERNLTGYAVGSNGVIFGPQGGLRASVTHMSNYITMLANGGVTKQGTRILSTESVQQMLKPRYQYHGKFSGSQNDFHLYGFGLYTTTYRKNDNVFPHEVVRGHTGSAYGLISGYYFWKNYTLTYIVNGALNGYGYGTGTIYERQRLLIYDAVNNYVKSLNQQQANNNQLIEEQ